MISGVNRLWREDSAAQLAQILLAIDNKIDMQNFLRDVMTEKEIMEIGARLEAARMLRAGKTYTEITRQTKLSSRTVARISDWLQNGTGGYNAALTILGSHHDHNSPARA